MQQVIWFALYVVLILALAAWRNHHDSATHARKNRHSTRKSAARQPAREGERRAVG